MNTFVKLWRETKRILLAHITLLLIAVTALSVLWFCLNGRGKTALDTFILNPSKNSALLGALLFALLTLIHFHRDYKHNTDKIIRTYTDPIFYQIRRTLALIGIAVFTTLILSLFTLPYALINTKHYFQMSAFIASWYLIFLGALVLSILISSGLYMLFRRVEIAFIATVGLISISKILDYQESLNPSYLLYWIQTNTHNFSDAIVNTFQIDMILWNRLFCSLVSIGIWSLGLCSLRNYNQGIIASFMRNCKRTWMPVLLTGTIILSGSSYVLEPIFDDSVLLDASADYDSGTGLIVSSNSGNDHANTNLLLLNRKADVEIDTDRRRVLGTAVYTIQNLTDTNQILPLLINTGFTIDHVMVNGLPTDAICYNAANKISTTEENHATWHINIPAKTTNVITLSYSGKPKNNGTIVQQARKGISKSYVDLTSISVAPWAYTDISEVCTFSCFLTMDEQLTPVFIDEEPEKLDNVDGKTKWHYSKSSTGIQAAAYHTKTFKAGGLDVSFKYFAIHEESIVKMDAINVMKAVIDYFTKVYGPLPYKDQLIVLELPAIYSGGYASGILSAIDETRFNAAGYIPSDLENPDLDDSGIDILVHELAHQWWGLTTFPVTDETSCWSAEGITCYSSYRFMADYYGETYAKAHYFDVWQNHLKTYQNAFYIQHPEYLKNLSANDAAGVMHALNTIRLYDIMPLQLLKAEAAIGSVEDFQSKLSALYQKHLYNLLTYEDFMSEMGLSEEVIKIE